MQKAMGTINHNQTQSVMKRKRCCMAEEIYRKLNQGSLFEIYQIIERLEGKEEMKEIEQIFLERYHFDFMQYI